MKRICLLSTFLLLLTQSGIADDLIFADNFNDGLSAKWELVGLSEDDYRIRDGGLELRIQTRKDGQPTPHLKVDLPFRASQTVVASVEIIILDKLTNEKEAAGLMLTDADGWSFSAQKQFVDGELVFDPGNDVFLGEKGEEGDPEKWSEKHALATPEAGPIRIVVDRGTAFFQVGPGKNDKYQNFFYSAIREKNPPYGFALYASGAKAEDEHWVRFENFRVMFR